MLQKLPIYKATIKDETDGVFCLSFVDFPATEVDWQMFSKQEVNFSIENEEKRLVRGVFMTANHLIYRVDETGYEYYITFGEDTLRKIAERFLANGYNKNVDTNHNAQLEEGIYLQEIFFKDVEKGVNPIGFENVEDKSLFCQYRVENDEIWNAIKEGKFKGFSMAGFFDVEPVQMSKQEINNNSNNRDKMKLSKIKSLLQTALMQFGRLSTDKGLISYESDNELPEVGESIYLVDEEGNESVAADGEYTLEDNTVIVVAEGKCSEVREPVKEEEPVEENVEAEDEEPAQEETPAEPASEPSVSVDEVEALKERIKNLEAEVARLETENGELRERIAELEKEPSAEPATEEFEKQTKVEKTGNKKLDRLSAILGA